MIKSRAKAQAIKAMAHQEVSIKHSNKTNIVFDCSDPGTGKTFVRIAVFAERRRKKKAGCALVLAPRSLLKTTWADDFKKFAPDMKVSVARAENREEAFKADADVYVTNHDGVKWLKTQPKAFWAKFEELIIDESTAYKHHTSQRSKAVAKIAHQKIASKPVFKYRSAMTGTPNSRSITDVWHQAYILDEGARLGPNFYQFRNAVSIPEQVGRRAEAVRWVDKPGAEEAVFGLLNDIVIRHKFEDCVDIPENHEYTLDFELTPKMRKAYEQLERDAILPLLGDKVAQARARLKGLPTELTAVNAAAVMTKMLQVCSGAVYDNDRQYHWVDDARYELVMDLVEEREGRHPLVFFYWQHQRDFLSQEAEKRGLAWAVIDGNSTDKERDATVYAYNQGKYDVLFAHPLAVAHGMTLIKGTSTIWTGPTYNAEWYKQGSRRQYRIGQKKKTENVMVLAADTREHDVYQILLGKNARMKSLLDLFQTAV
jgi:SNF2 family DNA or RNA helicase